MSSRISIAPQKNNCNIFEDFYNDNPHLLAALPNYGEKYVPGKKQYRNINGAINVLFDDYIQNNTTVLQKTQVIAKHGWNGPSTYIQRARVLSNFDLIDESFDSPCNTLTLNVNGLALLSKYKADTNIPTNGIPSYTIDYLTKVIEQTDKSNITLWTNTILCALRQLTCEGEFFTLRGSTQFDSAEKQLLIKYYGYQNNDIEFLDWIKASLEDLELIQTKNNRNGRGTNYSLNTNGTNLVENWVKNQREIKFYNHLKKSGLSFNDDFVTRFITALAAKPFILLTGLSGSGKTKIAQAFSTWITETENQICLVPVGADWTSREPLLGYPNALVQGKYVKPDNGVLDLIIRASADQTKPFFLILDEMNLSHVERYFADFLSTMESGNRIHLHPDTDEWKDNPGGNWNDGVPAWIELPKNLFIIGTVNIDETTYMFSPKVLDRANVIEFRITGKEISDFMRTPIKPNINYLKSLGADWASDFLKIAYNNIDSFKKVDEISDLLMKVFDQLKNTGFEFGYRPISEVFRFCGIAEKFGLDWKVEKLIDAAIIQKLLPKIHGSRKKLEPVLTSIAGLCFDNGTNAATISTRLNSLQTRHEDIDIATDVLYKLSLDKILRMKNRVIQDGFTSFAEA